MTDKVNDNLVLFPKTLDYYQIQLTKMLETERYGESKALLQFLLQCQGEAQRHHTEWQALLGWLEAAFPELEEGTVSDALLADDESEQAEESWLKERLIDKAHTDSEYISQLLVTLCDTRDPEQQLLILSQLLYLSEQEIASTLEAWLAAKEYLPQVQFKALQVLRTQGASGPIAFWRNGERISVEVEDTPLSFTEFPKAIHEILGRVHLAAEISDPTLSYFADEMWKEFVQYAYGTPMYESLIEEDDSVFDLWGAALHQLLLEKLHGGQSDEWIREQYGITDELRFRYEQALRWMRNYSLIPPKDKE